MKHPACGFLPISNYVVVLPDEEVVESPGGIVIPPAARARVYEGRVVAIGGGLTRKSGRLVPVNARVGDRVTFTIVKHHTYEHGGKRFLVMREPEILGVHPV